MAVPVALLAIGGTVGLFSQASPAGAAARITVVESAVEWRPAGATDFEALEAAADVKSRSVVRTSESGVAELAYADGSLTRLGPSTSYEITTLDVSSSSRRIVGRLEMGRTFHRVSKLTGSESRFEVHTSNAVAAVRGTAFAVDCVVRDVCEVGVTEGIVEVGTPDGESVNVTAGRRVKVGADGRLGPLESLSMADPWIASNAEAAAAAEPTADVPKGATEGSAPPSEPQQTSDNRGNGNPPAAQPPGTRAGPAAPANGAATTAPGRNLSSTSERRDPVSSLRRPSGSTSTTSSTSSSVVSSPPNVPQPVPEDSLCPGWPSDPNRSPTAEDHQSGCVPCQSGDAGAHNPICSGALPAPVSPGRGGSDLPAPARASRPSR